jgi:hypothetical protein
MLKRGSSMAREELNILIFNGSSMAQGTLLSYQAKCWNGSSVAQAWLKKSSIFLYSMAQAWLEALCSATKHVCLLGAQNMAQGTLREVYVCRGLI